mgnify:CR=1 FL=1
MGTYSDNRRKLNESRRSRSRNKDKEKDKKLINFIENKKKREDQNNPPKKDNYKRKFPHPKGTDVLSYPLGMTPDEENGGRLQIKCFEYVAPGAGTFGGDVSFLRASENMSVGNGIDTPTLELSDSFTSAPKGSQIDTGNYKKNEVLTVKGQAVYQLNNSELKNLGSSDKIEQMHYVVELPIPQDVNDSNTVTWGDDSKNILQLAGLAAGTAFVDSDGKLNLNDIRTKLQTAALEGLDEISNNKNAILAAATGKALDAFGAQVSPNAAVSRSTGQILNSNLELLFDSVNLRSFPFSIIFSPRNAKESMRVKHIIRAFKSSMAAKKKTSDSGQGGAFLKAPDVFKLRYLHNGKDHPFLNSFKPCALTGMTVNYTNAGTFASYSDGTPVSIQMNLTFKELNPIYQEDYDIFEPNDLQGVGF